MQNRHVGQPAVDGSGEWFVASGEEEEKGYPKTQVSQDETWGTRRSCAGGTHMQERLRVIGVASRTLHELREGMRHPKENPRPTLTHRGWGTRKSQNKTAWSLRVFGPLQGDSMAVRVAEGDCAKAVFHELRRLAIHVRGFQSLVCFIHVRAAEE
jgi:hypothetical protein